MRHVDLVAALDARGAELARRVDQLEALSAVGGIVGSSLVLEVRGEVEQVGVVPPRAEEGQADR